MGLSTGYPIANEMLENSIGWPPTIRRVCFSRRSSSPPKRHGKNRRTKRQLSATADQPFLTRQRAIQQRIQTRRDAKFLLGLLHRVAGCAQHGFDAPAKPDQWVNRAHE